MGKIQISTGKENVTSNTATVWDRIVALESNLDDIPENIGNTMESLETQLAQSVTQLSMNNIGTPLSAIGCIPNDLASQIINASLIYNAISEGKPLFIDGEYYVGSMPQVVNNDINLLGDTTNSKIIATGANIFTIGIDVRKIIVDGVYFSSYDKVSYIFQHPSNINIILQTFNIEKCTFEGSIRLAQFDFLDTTNPNDSWYGVRRISFCDNNCNDLPNSFFACIDMPFDFIKISRNVVRNFKYVLFNFGNTNSHSYGEEIKQRQLEVVYSHNNVKNDDDWWCPEDAIYHCALLVESKSVLFTNNSTEGLKSLGNIALYDGYLSSEYVLYENNIWKNNVIFNSNMLKNNTLMKAKGGSQLVIYRGNTFIIERDFPARMGQSEDLVSTFLYQMTTYSNWIVENNKIDVIRLRTMTSSNRFIDLTFKNNVIKTKFFTDKLAYSNPSDSDPFQFSNAVIIEGNDITVDEVDHLIDTSFILYASYNNDITKYSNTVDIKDNILRLTDSPYLTLYAHADKLQISGNTIFRQKVENVSGKFMLSTYPNTNTLISENNVIIGKGVEVVPLRGELALKTHKCSTRCFGKHVVNSDNYLAFSDKIEDCKVNFKVRSEGINGYSDFKGSIKLGTNTSNQRTLTFTATDNIEYSSVLLDGTNNNKRIKLEGINIGGFELVFYNTTSSCFVYLKSTDTERYFELDVLSIPLV